MAAPARGIAVVEHVGKDVRMVRIVEPWQLQEFADGVCKAVLDRPTPAALGDFALGYAACIDMLMRGTVDFDAPAESVARAFRDVNDVSDATRQACGFLRSWCEAGGGS